MFYVLAENLLAKIVYHISVKVMKVASKNLAHNAHGNISLKFLSLLPEWWSPHHQEFTSHTLVRICKEVS